MDDKGQELLVIYNSLYIIFINIVYYKEVYDKFIFVNQVCLYENYCMESGIIENVFDFEYYV